MNIFHGTRPWVYPAPISGRFSAWHKRSAAVLFAILLFLPWIRVGGHPVFLADLSTRKVDVMGFILMASDGVLILLFALMAAFGLFFFTTLFGRLWCGYMCPQSVFMLNLVYPIERWIEGTRGQQMARDKGPWTADKVWRKVAKNAIYVVLAVIISMSFMGFFVPAPELWTGQASGTAYGVVAFFTGVWVFDFTWYREQTCNYVCPYARFQGALTDNESLVITYDVPRGEPRGRAAKERGGCIDCNKCVVVCPQGIDIRDGYQLECIACGKCIDACTSVMDKLGHPTLVRYSTAAQEQGEPHRWLRPRTAAYAVLLSALLAGLFVFVSRYELVELNVDRAPGSLYVVDDDGYVRNMYMLNVASRHTGTAEHTLFVAVDGLPEDSQVRARPITLASSGRTTVPLIVRVPSDKVDDVLPLTITLRGEDIEIVEHTTFKAPRKGG